MIQLKKETLNESLVDNEIMIIHFSSQTSDAEAELDQTFRKITDRHPSITVAGCNADLQPEITAIFGVKELPAIAIVREGILVFRRTGKMPDEAIDDLIYKVQHLNMDQLRENIARYRERKSAES